MTGRPFFSIITIVYNEKKNIEETIKSVIGQSEKDVEYIIIDGGSTDGTLDVIKQYAQKITHFKSERDEGISDAFNKGLSLANGKWVNFMNAGDRFVDETVLCNIKKEINHSEDYDLIYGRMILEDFDHKSLRKYGKPFNRARFKFEMNIPHQSSFFNRQFFNAIGEFDKRFKLAMDYEILLRKEDLQVKFVSLDVAYMMAGGISQQNVFRVYNEFRQAKKKNSIKSKFLIDIEYYFMLTKVYIERFIFKRTVS